MTFTGIVAFTCGTTARSSVILVRFLIVKQYTFFYKNDIRFREPGIFLNSESNIHFPGEPLPKIMRLK